MVVYVDFMMIECWLCGFNGLWWYVSNETWDGKFRYGGFLSHGGTTSYHTFLWFPL
jgi:hypothetical protein